MAISAEDAERYLNQRFPGAEAFVVVEFANRVGAGRAKLEQAETSLREMGYTENASVQRPDAAAASHSAGASGLRSSHATPAASSGSGQQHGHAAAASGGGRYASSPAHAIPDVEPVSTDSYSQPNTQHERGRPVAHAAPRLHSQRANSTALRRPAPQSNAAMGGESPGRGQLSGAPKAAVAEWVGQSSRYVPAQGPDISSWRQTLESPAHPSAAAAGGEPHRSSGGGLPPSGASRTSLHAGPSSTAQDSNPSFASSSAAGAAQQQQRGMLPGGSASPARALASHPTGASSASGGGGGGGAQTRSRTGGPSARPQAVHTGDEVAGVGSGDLVLYMTTITADMQVRDRVRHFERLLFLFGLEHHAFDVSENKFIRRQLVALNGGEDRGLPLLFVGDRCVGTYDEVQDMVDTRVFIRRLQELGLRDPKLPELLREEERKRRELERETEQFLAQQHGGGSGDGDGGDRAAAASSSSSALQPVQEQQQSPVAHRPVERVPSHHADDLDALGPSRGPSTRSYQSPSASVERHDGTTEAAPPPNARLSSSAPGPGSAPRLSGQRPLLSPSPYGSSRGPGAASSIGHGHASGSGSGGAGSTGIMSPQRLWGSEAGRIHEQQRPPAVPTTRPTLQSPQSPQGARRSWTEQRMTREERLRRLYDML